MHISYILAMLKISIIILPPHIKKYCYVYFSPQQTQGTATCWWAGGLRHRFPERDPLPAHRRSHLDPAQQGLGAPQRLLHLLRIPALRGGSRDREQQHSREHQQPLLVQEVVRPERYDNYWYFILWTVTTCDWLRKCVKRHNYHIDGKEEWVQ